MLLACYVHAMAALQVKNVPEDLHEQLRERAEAEGVSISELVLAAIRRELNRPRMQQWFDEVVQDAPTTVKRSDIVAAIAEGRRDR
jgi:post-segregation antitoxin (ccd killing protein)